MQRRDYHPPDISDAFCRGCGWNCSVPEHTLSVDMLFQEGDGELVTMAGRALSKVEMARDEPLSSAHS